MSKALHIFIFLLFVVPMASAQTTILDFETPETSTVFQYFGSSLDGTLNEVIPNPDPTGENTSEMVASFVKPAVAEVWAGAFSNPDPQTIIDLSTNNRIAIKVWMDHIGSLSLKLEASPDGGPNWLITVPNTKVNEWETLYFDAAIPSIEAPNIPAAGYSYARVVLFFDFGSAGTGEDVTSYFDDIIALPAPPVVTTILDFEAPETSTVFQYFGSPLDGTFTEIIANPNPSGINTSDNVTEYVKPAVAEVWAGAFSNPNPETPLSLDPGSQVCIKVHMDHIGNLALKLEGGAAGQPNWITTVANTLVNEWEEICFDITAPSLEPPFEPAGGIYTRVVLFFDFGTSGTGEDVTSYFDDLVVKATGAPQARMVSFSVDMNSYTANFDQVYISGSFNNWSGDANPLSDPDFDGIWEVTLELVNGAYEYKITLDNWAADESFGGLEECTRTDPSGQFHNRLLLVSGDTDVPGFCYNSCYACGQEVSVTIRLGMGDVDPSPDGVWLAGGGNFEVPGGRYLMQDDDADGVWEITFPRALGFSSFYTFANGNCPDYSCKEDISGQDCADPNNFNDRFLPGLSGDVVIETCFAICATNTECTVGTRDLHQDQHLFELYGNPTISGTTYLRFGTAYEMEKTVTLYDALGRVRMQQRVGPEVHLHALETMSLPAGIYLVKVTAGQHYYTRTLIH